MRFSGSSKDASGDALMDTTKYEADGTCDSDTALVAVGGYQVETTTNCADRQ